ASDAGIYVGQSENIIVRRNRVVENVAGIEIENSNRAEVFENLATKNTGGILVFDLPGLPKVGGGDVIVARNAVIDNNTENFAPEGNIVASVPAGTGVMVMANTGVLVVDNALINNSTSHVMLIAYTQEFDDERYEPRPVNVELRGNIYGSGRDAPDFPGGDMLLEANNGLPLPPILTDGLHDNLIIRDYETILSLGLTKVGQSLTEAQPKWIGAGAFIPAVSEPATFGGVALPDEMEERLK
ncbi:MAG: parallel beta-helix domain-containing protein, partial [Pseudomonadota bacterium]